MEIGSRLTLADGVEIPRFGLGLYQTGGGKRCEDAVRWALEAGYRHFDTAALYRNETELGNALRRAIGDGLVKREDVFVTTKLWNDDH
ncbi:MAG: aldo/keto reductase, partial [Alphaproteobacteria bacterium]